MSQASGPAPAAPDVTHLSIAGISIELRYPDASLKREFPGPTRRFVIPPEAPEVTLTVERLTAPPAGGRLLFDSGGVWRLFETEDGYRFECRSPLFGDAPYKVALLDRTFTRGRVLIRDGTEGPAAHPLDYPLDEVLIGNLLGRGRGIEFHGCGIVDAGRGYLLVGQSGAGKTTSARLWSADPSVEIVSDDRVIIRSLNGGLQMYGTPWHGEAELSTPSSAPLSGIFLLAQAPVTELVELHPAQAAATLFGCTFPPFYDAGCLAFTLEMLDRIVHAVPVRELRFTPDASAVACVRAAT